MLYQDILIRESASFPEYLKRELLDFLFFLKKKEQMTAFFSDLTACATKPAFGCGAVKINIAPDFDEPLDDFKEYMA